jgi:hypothetical protein
MMPLDPSEFPEEVQVAFFMLDQLSDSWDGMSGTYLGKNWDLCEFLFKMYNIENARDIFLFMKMYETCLINHSYEKKEKSSKASAGAPKTPGTKKYRYNKVGK